MKTTIEKLQKREEVIVNIRTDLRYLNEALDAVLNCIDIIPAKANKMADMLRSSITASEYELEDMEG